MRITYEQWRTELIDVEGILRNYFIEYPSYDKGTD